MEEQELEMRARCGPTDEDRKICSSKQETDRPAGRRKELGEGKSYVSWPSLPRRAPGRCHAAMPPQVSPLVFTYLASCSSIHVLKMAQCI